MSKLFLINPDNGLYAGETHLVDSLLPIDILVTVEAPPDAPDGFVVRWVGAGWITEPSSTFEANELNRAKDIKLLEGYKALEEAKRARVFALENITVTTQSGRVFDGNEDAQNRMSRAITAMEDTDTISWVLADNTVALVSRTELKEALKLAGAAMAEVWVLPYQTSTVAT